MKIQPSLNAFKKTTGLSICIYDLGHHLTLNNTPLAGINSNIHQSKFCMNVKNDLHKECIKCDHDKTFAMCEKHRDIYVKTCHASVKEITIPVFENNNLLSVIFIGPFRLDRKIKNVPFISKEKLHTIKDLANILQGFIKNTIIEIRKQKIKQKGFENMLCQFFQNFMNQDPQVIDLAKSINLSTSRTRHLVKEKTGKSFQEHKDYYRTQKACQLLESTSARIKFIASQCGFIDSDYFCRYFKSKKGITPTEFRSKFGTIEEA